MQRRQRRQLLRLLRVPVVVVSAFINLTILREKEMPVPDYENDLVFPPRHDKTAYELQLENNKLRGLLAECKPFLNAWLSDEADVSFTTLEVMNFLTRINTALSESEE